MTGWVAAFVKSGTEYAFVRGLSDMAVGDERVFVPGYEVITKPRRKRKPVKMMKPLLSGVAFVQKDENGLMPNFRLLHMFRRVLVRNGSVYVIAEGEMDEFRQTCQAVGEYVGESGGDLLLVRDMRIEVKSGPLAGKVVVVKDEKPGSDGRVLVEFNGMDWRVSVGVF